jgi:glucosamine 6-phosphate synthetase-like amidotransferase/phosphosugar isomerase protein
MARNKWIAAPRMSNEEIEAKINEFKANGGEVIVIDESFDAVKKKNETAVKLGKTHRQLRALKKKE